jgi:hypothetical protein
MKRAVAGNRVALAVSCVALLLTISGAAVAATAGGSKQISACVKAKGGAFYEAKKCGRGDRRLTWNQTGPAGVTGATGGTGPQGPPGTPGTAGTPGTDGTGATTIDVKFTSQSGELTLATFSPITLKAACGTNGAGVSLESSASGWAVMGTFEDNATDTSSQSIGQNEVIGDQTLEANTLLTPISVDESGNFYMQAHLVVYDGTDVNDVDLELDVDDGGDCTVAGTVVNAASSS